MSAISCVADQSRILTVNQHPDSSLVQVGVRFEGVAQDLLRPNRQPDHYETAAMFVHLDAARIRALIDELEPYAAPRQVTIVPLTEDEGAELAGPGLLIMSRDEAVADAALEFKGGCCRDGRPPALTVDTKVNVAALANEIVAGVEAAKRESVLAEAERIINGSRAVYYGDAGTNHQRIANLWNAFLLSRPVHDSLLQAHEVALMMVFMKVARLIESPGHRDSYVDMAGYTSLAHGMTQG